MSAFLEVGGLSKRFGDTRAVDRLSLSLERGKVLALLGPSGCGKTTTLRLLAGFEGVDEGRIVVGGDEVTALPAVARRFGMVFQHYALFPHLDVGGNAGFGLETRGASRSEVARRVAEALAAVDLVGFERRRVGELSGGQQQRVALARALAPEPRVLLLDEPLSNLDPTLRERTRFELRQLVRRIGITTVLVTHEQEEAFDLGDRVAVLRAGRLEQEGTPEDLYDRPVNAFVAGFVGRASELPAVVVSVGEGDTGAATVRVEGATWRFPGRQDLVGGSPGTPVVVSVRPEALAFSSVAGGILTGEVLHRRFTGARALFTVRTAGGVEVEVESDRAAASPGETVGIVLAGERGVHVFPAAERA